MKNYSVGLFVDFTKTTSNFIKLFYKHCPMSRIYTVFNYMLKLVNKHDILLHQLFCQFHDLYTELDLHQLWVVSMGHLQRVWHASRERLPFRTPGSVPHCGTWPCSNCWDQIPRTCHVFTRLFTSNTPWYFSILLCKQIILVLFRHHISVFVWLRITVGVPLSATRIYVLVS